MSAKKSVFDNATIRRAIERTPKRDGGTNLIYSIELTLNEKPLIITMRVGNDFSEVMVTDKKTGEMLEHMLQKGGKLDMVKRHKMNFEQVKKMLELPKS